MVVFAPDHPGLFMRVAGALALSGASIVDARIFTTTDGMALMQRIPELRALPVIFLSAYGDDSRIGRALELIHAQCDLGPRPPGSAALEDLRRLIETHADTLGLRAAHRYPQDDADAHAGRAVASAIASAFTSAFARALG